MVKVERILIITTSQNTLGDSEEPTGVWAEELAVPYYLFLKKGYFVDVASIGGGPVPMDPLSIAPPHSRLPLVKRFLGDVELQGMLKKTTSIAYIDQDPYVAIFIPGGHGIAWDGPFSKELTRIVQDAYAADKVIGAVCHGPAGLINAQSTKPGDPDKGRSILLGKQVTGLSNSEEEAIGRAQLVPFLLEDKLLEIGAFYQKGPRDLGAYAVKSGHIVTGQNPASSTKTAELIVEALSFGVRLTP